jgi:hypothetical protein
MRQSLPRSLTLLVLGFFLAAPGYAGDEKGKSPEDVFKAVVAAMKKQDMKAMMSHMTRDSQSKIAGSMWLRATLDKAFTGMRFFEDTKKLTPKEKEHIAAIDKVLNRHSLSEDALRKIAEKDKKEPTWDEEMFVAIGEYVKDKAAFVREILKVLEVRLEPSDLLETIGKSIAEAKVKEVKIDGQQAKSQVTFPGSEGKESKGTIYFKLESEVWKIDLIETNRNWPPPPPSPQVQPQVEPRATPSYSRPGLLRRLLDRLRNW